MAKNYRLIPDESSNWEVAIFLLIDHIHPSIGIRQPFSRSGLCTSIQALTFIEQLLGSIYYEVRKTLENSISSAITRIDKAGYVRCAGGECNLTELGLDRLHEIKSKYEHFSKIPVGKTKAIAEIMQKAKESMTEAEFNKFKQKILTYINK